VKHALLLLPLLLISAPALAQQTTNNVVTQADDAFGRATGNERIGIYSSDEVRGFNPTEAGNNRLEGLFIEQVGILSPRLQESSSVRVGIAARGTPFPAPTGIVETRMEKFTGKSSYSLQMEAEDYSNVGGAIEAKIPLAGEKLGVSMGVGFRESDQVQFRNGSFRNYMASISYLPSKDSEFILFTSGAAGRSQEFAASFFPAGSYRPPEQPMKLQQSQPWAISGFRTSTSGGIAKFPIGDYRVEAGLFRATKRDPESFFTLLLGVTETGAVRDHLVIADKNTTNLATSGEIRLSRTWTGEKLRHSLIASIRGRDQDRAFGGQQNISLGASQAGIQDFRPEPVIATGPDDHSNVRQFIYGLQYNLQSRGGSSLSLAVQKSDYRKTTDFANPALTDPVVRDAPWLFSVSGALAITPKLTLYGGYVRGQEDSAVAPDIAINRSEAPPALRTRQMDAGLRFAITPKITFIGGVFDIRKPYFGVDSTLRFTSLGDVSNRGIELSLAGSPAKGLTLVAGAIAVNPTIKGAEVDAGRLGKRPVGTFKKRGIFNLDWRPGGTSALSVDLALDVSSGLMGDRLNRFSAGGKTNLNLGTRYRFSIGDHKILIRGQVQNALNDYSWRVNSGGGFTMGTPRIFYLQAVADF
jgi:iron complex outermembrane recepter protein